MVTQGIVRDRVSDTNWFVYILELENNRYYIGIAVDPNKRFQEHVNNSKDSANWCKKYQPKRIIEIINTNSKQMIDATWLEDIYTLKYIKLYGVKNVRGGRYLGSDAKVLRVSKNHVQRGYISMAHKLLENFNLTSSDLKKMNIYDFVMNGKNFSVLNYWLLTSKGMDNPQKYIIDKILYAQKY